MRETSVEAFRAVMESGAIGRLQRRAYKILYDNGPMSARELSTSAGCDLWKRLSELKRFGLAEEVGKAKCSVSGFNAILWDVTNNTPSSVRDEYSAAIRKVEVARARYMKAVRELRELGPK